MSGSRSRSALSARVFVLVITLSLMLSQVVSGRTPDGRSTGPAGASVDRPGASVEAGLLDKLRSGELKRFVVDFEARADLGRAWTLADHSARGQFVVNRLNRAADQAQAQAREIVKATRGASFKAFWIRNSMLVTGGASLAERLALLDGVAGVRAERTFPLVRPVRQKLNVSPTAGAPEWGVDKINADEVWAAGILGTGVVVGNIDTGVDFTHEALVSHYRGNEGGGTFSHDFNWWDPTDICGPEPCDNALHGTHTMGTMVGGDGPGGFEPDIGVAPGAEWIAAKGCEDNFCSEFALLSSGEFMLAPTDLAGENPDPDKRPHILNNSWGGGPFDDWYLDIVTAWRASGIIPVFSSGNPGPDCGFGGSPGDYLEAFSAGATDIDDVIADFSGRGPSEFGKINPDIAAPGVDVISSIPGDEYASFNGTSMAAPHAAGTLALMLSAAPALKGDFEAATSAVRDTALDIIDESCGGEEDGDPNNVYGDGRIDAQAAVLLVATGGTLTGMVTDALSGEPLPGAEVTADGVDQDYTGFTDEAGVYELFVQEGEYDVTASVYGYGASTANDIDVVQDEETVVDFELDALPAATVSGTVTDASGHGWPLYARIDIDGYPGGPVFTDPVTGEYSVELVQSTEFTFHVSTVHGAYVDPARAVGPLTANAVEDFGLAIDVELCDAPGYEISVDGLAETFSDGELPTGWTIVDNAESGQVWEFDDPAGRGNLTGAAGGFATVDSDNFGPSGFQDTELLSPVIDLTTVDAPNLRFATDYVNLGDTAEVDLSVDGGETWDNLISWNEDVDGPHQEVIAIPAAANQADVQVRFHYFDASWAWWWQVDHVIVGGVPGCDPVAGGLLTGNVYDGLTGLAINGASVVSDDDAEVRVKSVETPEDVNLDDGFYLLFSPMVGESSFTASASQYSADTRLPVVVADGVVRQDFELGAGRLVPDPGSIEVTLPMGGTTSETLTITNDGTAEATFELRERAAGRDILSLGGAPTVRRSGTFSPHSLQKAGDRGASSPVPGSGTDEAPWTDVGAYPSVIMDSTADSFDGLVYSVGGFDGGANLASGYVYDPGSDAWSPIADMAEVREKPAAAFVDGLLYVLGGWDDSGAVSTTLEIYDPASDAWTTGAEAPVAYAAGTAVALDGLLYVIGGCTDFCGVTDVLVYDPGTDEWSFAAPYPEEVSWTHCGSLEGGIVCAGGVSDSTGELDTTYAYDPGSDSWTQLASMPQTRWSGGYVASDGLLIVSGGVTNNFETITNEGFAYDPATDSWSSIPNSNNTVYRGASACGFYKIGGSVGFFDPTDAVELLPDTDVCGVAPDVTWLAEDPLTDTLAPAGSTDITVSFDAGVPEIDQPGTYQAMITFKEDTPYSVDPVAVTMHVTPPADWGKLEGTITGLERCDTPGGPLAGANVAVFGVSSDFNLKADGDGYFEWWMPASNGPVTLTVSRGGWVTKSVTNVAIAAGDTTTEDVTLRLAAPCADAEPDSLEVTLLQNDVEQLELVLSNIPGARAYQFLIEETAFGLSPMAAPSVDMRPAFSAPAKAGSASIRSADRRVGPNQAGTNAPPWFGANDIPGGLVRFAHAQCDAQPNVFYVVGGVDGTFEVSDRLWRFDAESTEWTELASIPEGGEGPTATCEAGRIHVMGGDGTDRHYIYTIASDTWSTGAPLPRPVWGAAAAGWNGQIFLVGGDDDFFFGGASDEVNVYDIATDTWIGNGEPMPIPTAASGFFQSGPSLFIVGGWDDSSPDVNVGASQRYDLVSGTWEVGPWLGSPRADFALAATDQALYAIGGDEDGEGPFDASRTVERLDLAAWPDGGWEEIDQLGVALVANNGGFCGTATFDPGTEVWSAGGADANLSIQGRMLFRQAAGETCPTIRSDVDWLSVSAASGQVRRDRQRTLTVTVDADDLPAGEHDATLLISTTDPARAEMRVPVRVTVLARPTVAHLSVAQTATLDGVTVRNEDIFTVFDDGSVELLFDGSDLGMGGMAIDAFAFEPGGSLVMSFTQPAGVPGIIGTVDDSDLVLFNADSLGPDTAGTFVRYFDGSDVGLGTDAEDVDAVEIRGNGALLVSTVGAASVPGIASADDSDVLRFVPTDLGGSTSGSWHRWFDGSDVGLSADGEDLDALGMFGGVIGLSTTGALSVPGLTAADEDAVAFNPRRLGGVTRGDWAGRYFDGSTLGLGDNDITGFETS